MTASTNPVHLTLHAVLHQEGPVWVARCFELDLVTSGRDREQVWESIQRVCLGQIRYAMVHDPEFQHLFRPPSVELTRMMAMAREEAAPLVLRVNQVFDVTMHRLTAA